MKGITLNLTQFERLCTTLHVPPQVGGERRRAGRVEFRSPIMVSLTEGTEVAPPARSMLRDLSPRGMTLSHPSPMKPDSVVVVYVGDEEPFLRIVAKVMHCKCFSDGASLVGLEFQGFVEPHIVPAVKEGMRLSDVG